MFGNKKNMLLVEDDYDTIKMLKKMLKKFNLNIYVSDTGESALDVMRNKKIDIVLMDYKLPYKNGILLTKEMKKINNSVPIILETGESKLFGNIDTVKGFQFDDIIEKPLTTDKVVDIIKDYV